MPILKIHSFPALQTTKKINYPTPPPSKDTFFAATRRPGNRSKHNKINNMRENVEGRPVAVGVKKTDEKRRFKGVFGLFSSRNGHKQPRFAHSISLT